MAIVKSKLLRQLSKNYPNFLKKDLEKFIDIILKEIRLTLKRGERVELRGSYAAGGSDNSASKGVTTLSTNTKTTKNIKSCNKFLEIHSKQFYSKF